MSIFRSLIKFKRKKNMKEIYKEKKDILDLLCEMTELFDASSCIVKTSNRNVHSF